MSGFRPRDVDVFRPYPDEVPWELLAEAGVDETVLAGVLELNFVRVAKLEGRVVGAYAIRPRSPTSFELVGLVVADGYRRRGLGRWLLGHAIGLAETKGGREVLARGDRGRRFLERAGFAADPEGARLVLTPE